jgi:divalent metal cation (Fe/Co/Zn/Cd) transporter
VLSRCVLGSGLKIFTVLWMAVEAVISMWAGVLAHSTLFIAFGIDSVIELISGAILLWRLSVEAREEETRQIKRAEQRAAWVVAVSLSLLCIYVLGTTAYGLITRVHPDSSLAGIIISFAALIVMPVLGITKRRIAVHLESAA